MANARSQSVLGRLAQFGLLSTNQKIAIIGGLMFLAAVVAAAWIYASTPTYRVLYTNLSDRDGGDIIAALSQMNVPYKTGEGGAIMVPAGQVYEIRLKLASQGLPKGSSVGFELLQNQKFGASQFIEQVNYQRALEGELARSIESISAVKGARVHLAIPQQTVFVRDQQKPTASVLVSLYPGKTLDAAQVEGIVRLVAAAVPNMPDNGVTVIDQNGNPLSRNDRNNLGNQLDAGQLDYLNQMEHNLAHRIEAILSPLTGADNVRAQVTADIDFAQAQQMSEQYKPNGAPDSATIRSQQIRETSNGDADTASGVPGAASNQPGATGAQPPKGNAAPAKGGKAAAAAPAKIAAGGSRETVTNYEVDKTVRTVKEAPGSIKRLSVAVVVNNKRLPNKDGTVKYVPYTQQEMTQINNLVKEAMGFDQKRGDTLNVVNSAFNVPDQPVVEATPFYEKPENIAMAKEVLRDLAAAGVVLFVLLTVRRMILQMTPPAPPRAAVAPVMQQGAEAQVMMAVPGQPQVRPGVMAYEQAVNRAQDVARNDPAVVASVVKDWLANE